MVPLALLGELAAHEQELLAGMAAHEAVDRRADWRSAASGRPASCRAASPCRARPRRGESGRMKFSREGVEQPEGQVVVVVAAVDRLLADVAQRVVHPAHVPLEAEAEAAGIGRDATRRGQAVDSSAIVTMPGSVRVDRLVHAPQEVDRFEVLVAAVPVRDPLAGLARVVEVEHRRHRIDAQAVELVALEPEHAHWRPGSRRPRWRPKL